VVQIAFASQTVEGKLAMLPRAEGGEGIPAEAMAMARMLGAAAFFQVFARSTKTLNPTTIRDHVSLVGCGFLGIAANQALFLTGLRLTTPATAALLSITIPVVTAAIAVLLRAERASWRTGLGLLFAGSGGAWLVVGGPAAPGSSPGSIDRGALLISLNSVVYSLYIVLSRPIIVRLGAFTLITWIFTWAVFMYAPLGLAPLVHDALSWTPRAWALVAYIVAVPTIVAYLANAWALGRSSPSLVTIYIYTQPALAALLAWVQLGTGLTVRLVASAILIAVGVAVVATRRPVTGGSPTAR
jgi:drug/metabolite transporter (DMT)-like permease